METIPVWYTYSCIMVTFVVDSNVTLSTVEFTFEDTLKDDLECFRPMGAMCYRSDHRSAEFGLFGTATTNQGEEVKSCTHVNFSLVGPALKTWKITETRFQDYHVTARDEADAIQQLDEMTYKVQKVGDERFSTGYPVLADTQDQ